jgi:Beta-galactosidase trimerisation domain/Beta-galactosidase
MSRWIALLVAAAVGTSAAWADTTAEEVEEDNSLASTLVTPHKPWGKGLVGGPVRALFLVYTGAYDGTWEDTGTRVREVVELGQRFDLQADAVLFCGSGNGKWNFHGVGVGEARAERLLEKPYQLYCIAGFPMEKLPAKLQYLVLKQVAEGAGLLCCGQGAAEYLVARRQVNPTPTSLTAGLPPLGGKAPAEMVSAYRLGKGRGVWLNYAAHALTPFRPFSRPGVAEYDYWMLLIGRAALWAASREGEVSVASVLGNQAAKVSRGAASPGEVVLKSSAAQPLEAKVGLELCRVEDGERTPLAETSVTLPPGQDARVAVRLPRLRAGGYFVDAVVRSARGTEAFGAGAVTVESDFGVAEVRLDRTFIEQGETIYGTVLLRGAPPADGLVRVRLRDSYDRVLNQQDAKPTPGTSEVTFEYEADSFSTNEMRAEAVLLSGGEEVELKEASFSVPKRRHGQMNFVMWDAPMDTLGAYAWRQLQEVGMNTCLIGSMGSEPRPKPTSLLACDASLVPYSTRILDPKDEKGYMQPVCWNDEPAVTEYVQKIVDNQRLLREQGVFVYSLGDEGVTLGCCIHPACIAAYRRYLEGQYGTVDALNASWGTAYKSFEEVDLLDHADNMESAALRTCFPRWFDRQAFARWNLMHFSGRFVEAYGKLDPQALTGFEGTGGFGDDYDAIMGTNTFYGPYPSIGDDILRSGYARDRVRSNWMGYSKTGDALSDAAWRMVMKGMDSIWYWMWSGIGSWRGYLRPTLDLWPATKDLAEEMRPVRQGLGDLLLRSEMTHNGIAVLYSLPSALSGQLENSGQFISPQSSHQTWTQLTCELGLDFRYLTSDMLKRGVLTNTEFRVLVLPMTQAISPEEADTIRRFAEGGGTVVADVRPGIYDGHCRPLTPGALDDLFGIRRTGRGKPEEGPVSIGAAIDGQSLNVELPKARFDTEVAAAGAEALGHAGETPTLLVNRAGKGGAVLLNFQFLVAKAHGPEALAARQVLRFLYDLAGCKSAVTFTAPDGKPLPLTETRTWRTGNALVAGLWRHMENEWFSPKSGTVAGQPDPVRIGLPGPLYVYDLRGRRGLGKVSQVDTKLRWGRASFFLALPYAVPRPTLSVAPKSPEPGQPVTASLSLALPAGAKEQFAFWVEVTDPEGARPLWGRQVVMVEGGKARVAFATPYNAQPGKWQVRATELFSNQSAEATWTVRGGA